MKYTLILGMALSSVSCKQNKGKTPEIIRIAAKTYKFTPGLFNWQDFQKLCKALDDTSINYACVNEVCGQVIRDTVYISIKK